MNIRFIVRIGNGLAMKKRVPVLDTLILLHIQQPTFLPVAIICNPPDGACGTLLLQRIL